RAPAPAIPDEEALRVPGGGQILSSKQLGRIFPHQEGAVGPLAHEGLVVEPLLQQHVDHAQGEYTVSAGPDAEPDVRFVGEARLARVNDNEFGAVGAGPANPHGHRRPGRLRVETPEQYTTGLLVVWRGRATPIRVLRARVSVPLANVRVA